MRKPKIAVLLFMAGCIVFVAFLLVRGLLEMGKKSKAAEESTQFIFSPAAQTAAKNTDIVFSLKIKTTETKTIRGYYALLTFDKSKIQFKNVVYKLGQMSQSFADMDAHVNTVNQNGQFKLVGEISEPSGNIITASNETEIASFTFTVIDDSPTTIKLDGDSQKLPKAYYMGSDYTIHEISGTMGNTFALNGPDISPSPGSASFDVNLDLKLKFQGVVTMPKITDPILVKVRLKNEEGFDSQYVTGSFSPQSDGTWKGSAKITNVPASSTYRIYLKGPKHLQKKICDQSPTENEPGRYACSKGGISLSPGDNSFDFSGIYHLTGDLPNANGEQDGFIDSTDTSFIRANLGKSDTQLLTVADLNYDGIIDSQDFSLVIASLSLKYDEE